MENKLNILYNSAFPWSNMMSRYVCLADALSKSPYVNNLVYLEPLLYLGDIKPSKLIGKIDSIGRYGERLENSMRIKTAISPIPLRRYKISNTLFDYWLKYTVTRMALSIPPHNKILLLQGRPSDYMVTMLDILKRNGFYIIYDWGNLYEKDYAPISVQEKVALLCRKIASLADIVLGVSSPITKIALEYNKNSFTLTDAVSKDIISTKSTPKTGPEERLANPVICYYGMINPIKLDFKLIREVARLRPNWKFKFIGEVLNFNKTESDLYMENIELIPPMAGDSLHTYLQNNVDLCFIPYNKEDEVAYACSPLKLYESLGDGLPIVSTSTFDPVDAKEFVSFANTPNEIIMAMESEIKNNSEDKRVKRIEYAKKNTWDIRVEQLLAIIELTKCNLLK